MITAQQMQKYTQALFSQIYPTDIYDTVKQMLISWKEQHKSPTHAITTFLKIVQLIATQQPDLLDDLNRCLIKDYSLSPQPPTLARIKQLASENPNAEPILDIVINWLKVEQPAQTNGTNTKSTQLQQLSQPEFTVRLQKHERSLDISKLILLYRRCVLTIKEFKKLLEPIYLSDPSFFNMLFQYAEELEDRRRKITIFAPLNELVDQKYPLEQVGHSYMIIPDGYANRSRRWQENPLQINLNRTCVSVPLGTEGSFVITRKNQFQEQLLKNEEEKYEIDSNLISLRSAIVIIEKTERLSHPLVFKIISNIYTAEVVGIMLRSSHAEVAETIVLPRLKQKYSELARCRAKFEKNCQETASKNFYKSLDYRCFYFCKNDKKFNSQGRWEKEIEMRKRQVIEEEINQEALKIEDRQSLQHSRHQTLNSFDNITNQKLLEIRTKQFGERHKDVKYPQYPHNQVLFLVDFSDQDVLNDVLEIILYQTQKKTLMELLVFKLLKKTIDRRLQKGSLILQFIEGKSEQWETGSDPLNENKTNKRAYKDLTDEFLELIEEDIEPTKIQSQQFPFEGVEEHTFVGTKHCYFFIRYLVTIYHRFLRAKNLSNERGAKSDEPSLYSQFLSILIHKIKEQKGMEEYLRKIFQQDAYIFFTLDKLFIGILKILNNHISTDSLTYKILRDDVKDYDLQIRRWVDYQYPTVTEQLTRLYRERQMLFRFSFSTEEKLLYVSAWENSMTVDTDRKKKDMEASFERNIYPFMTDPVYYNKEAPSSKCIEEYSNEYFQDESGNLIMRGEEKLIGKRRGHWDIRDYEKDLNRVRKMRIL